MKIQQVKTNLIRLPLEEPLVGAPVFPGMLREFLTVQILTDDGIEGIGITTFGGKIVRTLKSALEEFGELVKGEDPLHTAQVEKGYRQIKTQMAVEGLNAAQEVERIRLIRDAVGPDTNLMVDINQRWSVHEAILIGRRVGELGLAWLEDPTAHNDYQGLAKIADALTTPICAGEYLYGIEPHRQSMTHHSVDIVMIDLLRVGGVTQWMKVAGMAEAFNMPVASHLLPEIHVHLIAAVSNGLVVEYMPWTWRLFDNPPVPENGEMKVPAEAGLGLKFAPNLFEKYGVS